jgi:hypothetical protein
MTSRSEGTGWLSRHVTPGTGLGTDLGATHIRAAIVHTDGTTTAGVHRKLPDDIQGRRYIATAVATELLRAHPHDQIESIGLAVAGTVTGGVLTWSANLGAALRRNRPQHRSRSRGGRVPTRRNRPDRGRRTARRSRTRSRRAYLSAAVRRSARACAPSAGRVPGRFSSGWLPAPHALAGCGSSPTMMDLLAP